MIEKPANSRPKLKSCLSESNLGARTPTPSSTLQKKVSFHQVQIREYERVVGINPSVTAGPAVSLAWDHHACDALHVEEYESRRPPRRVPGEFQIPSSVRTQMLERSGASSQDLQKAQQEITKIKRQRQATAAMQELEGAQIFLESIGRKWKRATSRKKQQQQQQDKKKNDVEKRDVKEESRTKSHDKAMDDTADTEQTC